jgi:hypothetical protein
VPPYTFSIVSGKLPPGLSLDPATGAITGTPTTAGTYNFTAKVVDSTGASVTTNCSITVAPPALTLTCASSSAQVGVPYSSSLVATGGVPPYTFSIVSGKLPPGLSLDPATGAITGTPTTAGTYNFTAKVMDSTGASVTTNCSITVAPSPLTLACASSSGEVGSPYSSSVVATGGVAPYTYSIVSGTLPPGLTLNPSTGAITGTPTSEGTFSFTVKVTDAQGNTATANCGITIKTCGTALTPITYNVHEDSGKASEIVWFNSHLTKLKGTIPSSDFQIFITGGKIIFGPSTLSVPDAVITFSSSASCSSTTFNVGFNRWETTIPLSSAGSADEIFAAGIAYQIPAGFPGAANVTWSADISSSAAGITATWQFGASNWLTQNKGSVFPALSESPFVPDYNGMMVEAAHNAPTCYGQGGDHAGAPEFSGRGDVLTAGGSGGGGSNWTGSWSSTPPGVQICQATGGQSGPCVAVTINQSIQPGANFAAIGLEGSNFQLSSGPLQVNGDLGTGVNALFHLSGGATLNSTLYADPSAQVQIDGGSGVGGGTVTESLSPLQTAAINLSNSAAALSPTQTFSQITSATTITGNGGQNVISVTGTFHLSGGFNLTIKGGSKDTFIFNAPNGLQLDGGSNIVLSGVSPNQVLFNFPSGGSGQVQTSGQANTAGIFLAPYMQMQINGGVHNSEFISGGPLSFQSNPAVTAPQCTQ